MDHLPFGTQMESLLSKIPTTNLNSIMVKLMLLP